MDTVSKTVTDEPLEKNRHQPDSSNINNHLTLIKQRKALRVGYLTNRLPFAFRNDNL